MTPTIKAMIAPHPVATARRNRGRPTRTRVGSATAMRFLGRNLIRFPARGGREQGTTESAATATRGR